jgi:hypothetical protein
MQDKGSRLSSLFEVIHSQRLVMALMAGFDMVDGGFRLIQRLLADFSTSKPARYNLSALTK